MNKSIHWRRLLLIGFTLISLTLVVWFCVLSASNTVEQRFVATLLAASALTLGFATRRAWFGLLCATAIYGLMWASSALKFKFLEVPAIAPDLYYFFSLDTIKVISGYPMLAVACLALSLGIPLLLWLAWHSDAPVDFSHYAEQHRRWLRRLGLAFGLLILGASLTPHGPYGDVYGKPMWVAVNDESFITDFIISFYDTQIHIPQSKLPSDPSIVWTRANAETVDPPAPTVEDAAPKQRPDIIGILEESTFDPRLLAVCGKNPLCKFNMFQADSRTQATGLLGVHTFGGGTWTSEFAVHTGLAHTLFGNAGLYAPYNLAPLVQFSVPKALKAQGYRVVALYPTNADFINGRNAYREYGFDKLYDGVELGLEWHAKDQKIFDMFWKLYQQEKLDHPGQPLFFFILTLHQHGPHMTAYKEMPAPYNKPLFPGQLGDTKGLDEWLNLNVANYLERNAESDQAMKALEARLLDRDTPTVLMHFGDHQPSFDGAMMVVHRVLPADWGKNGHWATYYMIKSNIPAAPRFDYPKLDIVYLGGLLLQASGIPEDPYYTANRLMRDRCAGRYEECADPRMLDSYHDYIFRQIKMLGE